MPDGIDKLEAEHETLQDQADSIADIIEGEDGARIEKSLDGADGFVSLSPDPTHGLGIASQQPPDFQVSY